MSFMRTGIPYVIHGDLGPTQGPHWVQCELLGATGAKGGLEGAGSQDRVCTCQTPLSPAPPRYTCPSSSESTISKLGRELALLSGSLTKLGLGYTKLLPVPSPVMLDQAPSYLPDTITPRPSSACTA